MDLTAKIVIKNCWVRIPKAYSTVAGTGKLTFFMRTIPNLGNLLKPLEDMIHFTFISSITGGHICSHHDRIIPFPLARFGGLGIPKFHEIALDKPKNTWSLVYSVVCILSLVYSVMSVFCQRFSAKEIEKWNQNGKRKKMQEYFNSTAKTGWMRMKNTRIPSHRRKEYQIG